MFDGLDGGTITWIWFICGIILIAAELFVPTLFIAFLGMGALLVAGLRAIGLVESMGMSFGIWLASSLFFVLSLRKFAKKFFPSDTDYKLVDDDMEAFGTTCVVLEKINDSDSNGRIKYQGTSWKARSDKGSIPVGETVKLLYRDDLVWIVQPTSELLDVDEDLLIES